MEIEPSQRQSEKPGKLFQILHGSSPPEDVCKDVEFANELKAGPIRMFTSVYDDVTLQGCDGTGFSISNAIRIRRYTEALARELRPLDHRDRVLAGLRTLWRLKQIWIARRHQRP